jgi:hypothetical protein
MTSKLEIMIDEAIDSLIQRREKVKARSTKRIRAEQDRVIADFIRSSKEEEVALSDEERQIINDYFNNLADMEIEVASLLIDSIYRDGLSKLRAIKAKL